MLVDQAVQADEGVLLHRCLVVVSLSIEDERELMLVVVDDGGRYALAPDAVMDDGERGAAFHHALDVLRTAAVSRRGSALAWHFGHKVTRFEVWSPPPAQAGTT
jgi:hypothetical protein